MAGVAMGEDPRPLALVIAAHDLLDSEGLDGLTIRAVLARTGLARRAFYDIFGGKDELVLAVFAYSLHDAARRFGELIAVEADPVNRLRIIVRGIVLAEDETALERGADPGAAHRRGAALAQEHLRLAVLKPLELQRAIAPLVDLLAVQLADGMAAGLVRQADPQRLAALVYNLVSTTAHGELLAESGHLVDRARRERLLEDVWQFCRRAIIA